MFSFNQCSREPPSLDKPRVAHLCLSYIRQSEKTTIAAETYSLCDIVGLYLRISSVDCGELV